MSDKVLSQFKPETHEENTIDCSRRLKFGIIGTGWIAESHVEALKQMPDVDIVAGADLIPGKAEAFFKRYGVENVRLYPSHKEMLEAETDLDAVCVCTYNKTHAECTHRCPEQGPSCPSGKAHVRNHPGSPGYRPCRKKERKNPLSRLPAPYGREHEDD